MPPPHTRVLDPDQWPEWFRQVTGAFLNDPDPEADADALALFERGRVHGVFDGDALLGGGAVLSKRLTLPGGRRAAMAGVSYVGVRPDARGRGTLTALMRAQLHGLHEQGGEPIAGLVASMAAIYGRFGYGPAARTASLTVPGRAAFRPGAPIGGTVRWLDEPAAAPHLRRLHALAATERVGWIDRPEASWRWWMPDRVADRRGTGALRYALHHPGDPATTEPDGYAVFRVRRDWTPTHPAHQVRVNELVTLSAGAHAGLWRSLLDIDMVASVEHAHTTLDDPLPLMLANPRAVLTDVSDNLWLRLVDLDRALPARCYAAPCDLVLEVTDRFCPWNAGRWRLRVTDHPGDDGGTAEVARTESEPELTCDTADLAEAFLGGTRITALAAAGRVREHRPGAVLALSRAMAGDAEPLCPEIF
jgi:predicted acetyltransferase